MLLALSDPAATQGKYYGPRWDMLGKPQEVKPTKRSVEVAKNQHLWQEAEKLTGVYLDKVLPQ